MAVEAIANHLCCLKGLWCLGFAEWKARAALGPCRQCRAAGAVRQHLAARRLCRGFIVHGGILLGCLDTPGRVLEKERCR